MLLDAAKAVGRFVANMRAEESELHRIFDGKRIRGEWFELQPSDLSLIASRARLV